jgi:fluoroquinolone resistance protein
MPKEYITDQLFEKTDYTVTRLPDADFEGCKFANCTFSGINLSGFNFTECVFEGCNLSTAKIIDTTFNDITFKDCKMLGLHFETANAFLFTVHFQDCVLDLSSFYKRNMKKFVFNRCSLREADFIETNLTEAVFTGCDLYQAKFENTILEKADLSKAFNYSIDPTINKLRMARFSLPDALRLLDKYEIIII